MGNRRNPAAKWVLPLTVHPQTSTCWKIDVPDDPFYRAAFWGALLNLASAYKWQDDPAHTAREVALVWRGIIDNLKRCTKEIEPGGSEVDFDMGIRIDCDCNVWVTCCDGTEVQLATVGMVNKPTQPGGGQITPPAPGACQNYQIAFSANQQWVLPALVNSGDVLTFNDWAGAGYDGSGSLRWFCPDGLTFFAGSCVNTPFLSPFDPAPTIGHMTVLCLINGVFYDVTAGSITVPGGVSDAQVIIQVNDDLLSDNSGDYQLSLELCNNDVPTSWVSTFNFVLNPYSGLLTPQDGVWAPGQGYKGTNRDVNDVSVVVLHLVVPGIEVSRMSMVYTTPGQGGANGLVGFETQGGFYGATPIYPGAVTAALVDTAGIVPGVTDIYLENNAGNIAGDTFISVATIYGNGSRPPGWPTS